MQPELNDVRRSLMTNSTSQIDQMPLPIRTLPDLHSVGDCARPLKLGHVEIGFPVVQAALSGYSDWPMRVVAGRLGAPYTIAEVLIDRFVLELRNRDRTKRHLLVTDEEHPVGGQLMGSDPAQFEAAAGRLVEAGFDVIDINFGCPVKTAIGGCRGGYHLGQPDDALEIIGRVRDAVPDAVPVTVKMRRGIDDSSVSSDRFFQILDGAFERGVSAVTVNGRSVEQKYNGPSNWDFLREVKQHAGARTILGSGDVFTAAACVEMLCYTGVDGVSAARGAIGNPWIFRQAQDIVAGREPLSPTLAEQADTLRMQLSLCREVYDDRQTIAAMRKFGIKFARLHPEHETVRNDFAKSKTVDQWEAVLDRWY